MKILVDLLALSSGGLNTYAAEVLPRLAERLPFEVLLGEGRGKALRKILPDAVRILEAPGWTANPFLRHIFQRQHLTELTRRRGADTVFVPGGLTGFRPRSGRPKLVVMLHNMLPFLDRERARYAWHCDPLTRLRLTLLGPGLLRTFRLADRVIYISRFSSGIVEPQVGHSRSRLIPHGLSRDWLGAKALSEPRLRKLGIGRNYFLYVSALDPYKHQDKLIEGFRHFRQRTGDTEHQLVLAGPPFGSYGRRVVRLLNRAENVVWLGAMEQHLLPPLLKGARCLLFASSCETCPNVLLEYLGAGRPIACSDSPPMPELGGNAVRYVAAEDPHAWAAILTELVVEPRKFIELGERARQRAELFSWDRTARETFRALSEWQD